MNRLFQPLRLVRHRRVLLALGVCLIGLLAACAGVTGTGAPTATPTMATPTPTAIPLPTPTLSKDELERQQAELELAKLRAESPYFSFGQIVATLGAALGLLTVGIAIIQGLITLRQQVTERKEEQIAKLLSALSDKEDTVRLGAARGLSRYANDVIPEVLSALRDETSARVRDALEEVLFSVTDLNLDQIVAANSETLAQRAYLLGRLRKLRANAEYMQALLRLSAVGINNLEKGYQFQIDQGKNFEGFEDQRLQILEHSQAEANQELINLCEQAAKLAASTGRVLAHLLRVGRRPQGLKAELDLSLTNLYRAPLYSVDLSRSLLHRCLLRHADLDGAKLQRGDLQHCDLYGATFNLADLSEADLTGAKVRAAVGREVMLIKARLDKAEFSEGVFEQADFSQAVGKKVEFNGAKLPRARFDGARLEEAEFPGAQLPGTSWRAAKCYRSEFMEANLSGAILIDAEFNGCDLSNADLSGADLANADFRGAKLDGVQWAGVKNRETAKF